MFSSGILLLLLLTGSTSAADAPSKLLLLRPYDGYQLIRTTPVTQDQLVALRDYVNHIEQSKQDGVEVWAFHPRLNESTDLFAEPSKIQSVLDFLDTNHILREVLVQNFGSQLKDELLEHVVLQEQTEQVLRNPEQFDLGRYHPFDTIVNYLRLLTEAHPEFIRMHTLGRTSEGRELPMLTLGYPSRTGEPKPSLLVDAGIHAREWIAPAVALRFIDALVNVKEFNALLSDIDIHVVPVLNPDGYVHTWDKDRLWRRTRSGPVKVTQQACGNYDDDEACYGVDPNRNFPFHWGEAGISKCPCSQVYNGEQPLSEPECASLAKYLSANNQTIRAYLTLHAYSNLIMHPFGFQENFYPDDVDDLRRVANAMAAAIVQAGGERFKVGSAPDVLYLVSGSSDDFARSQGIKYTFTMELTSGWYDGRYVGFVYPAKGISSEAAQVLPALRLLAEQVSKEALNGTMDLRRETLNGTMDL